MTAFAPCVADVSILHNDLRDRDGLPLVTIARNERALLPDFLAHYRRLGVRRFFVLDDASDDGSTDWLRAQGDVCLLGSTHRYGDRPEALRLPEALAAKTDLRMIHIWRTGLMNRFCTGSWAVQCDVDEFLMLPEGFRLDDVIARLEACGARGIWGGMIDLYPAGISDLTSYPKSGFTWPRQTWYFDGVRHFSLRAGMPPRHHYVGVRHRLDVAFAGKPEISRLARLKLRLKGHRKSPSGTLVKPVLQFWTPGAFYLDSHRTTQELCDRMLLPLLHYRYTPGAVSKLTWAMTSGGYSKGNADYSRLEVMLNEMRRQNAEFLSPVSRRLTAFHDLEQTGNAIVSTEPPA